MNSIVLYLHMHQPLRLKHYNIFSAGQDHDYWTEKDWYAGSNNERIFKKVVEKSYRPMLAKIKKCITLYPDFKFSLSITGVFIEQAEKWAPDILDALRELAQSGHMEIVAETYYHSLAFFFDRDEFAEQVRSHQDKIREVFGVETRVFRNTEFSYNNDLAKWAEDYGFKGIMAEGWDKVLGDRSPNNIYRPEGCSDLKLLTKNYRLSDDIAFRFPDKNWSEWPLTADKYIGWLKESALGGPLINLFMDFETFGENIWSDTGIFGFFEELVRKWSADPDCNFLTATEACDSMEPVGEVSMPWTVTWADTERDLSAWLGNSMQHEAMKNLYDLKQAVFETGDEELLHDWRLLQTSDHTYYMCTKFFNDGSVHSYFSPYGSPFDAFLYFSNVLRDMHARLAEKNGDDGQLPKPSNSSVVVR